MKLEWNQGYQKKRKKESCLGSLLLEAARRPWKLLLATGHHHLNCGEVEEKELR